MAIFWNKQNSDFCHSTPQKSSKSYKMNLDSFLFQGLRVEVLEWYDRKLQGEEQRKNLDLNRS